MSLEFTKLPLVEARARLIPSNPFKFDLEMFAHMHAQMQKLLPEVRAIGILPTAGAFSFQVGDPFGTDWFDSGKRLHLHFRTDGIESMWINESSQPSGTYPRFGVLESLIEEVLRVYSSLGTINFQVANMSYTNFVKIGTNPSIGDVQRFFGAKFQIPHIEPASLFHACDTSWRKPVNDVDIRITIQTASSEGPGKPIDAFMITTTCGKVFAPTDSPLPILQLVHEELQTFFSETISEYAKQEWGLQQ